MSTRARIGVQLERGEIKSVYVWRDGTPEVLGLTLAKHYGTPEMAAELVGRGNLIDVASELLPAEDCLGRICSISTVGCPPAIPPVMPGEVITREVLECFKYYGVGTCRVVR